MEYVINNMTLSVTIIRSRRRTLALQIHTDGVYVRAPQACPDTDIIRFLDEHKAWLIKHMDIQAARKEKLQELPPFTDEEKAEYVRRAAMFIPERVAYYAWKMGVTYGRISIRLQKGRYGSCSAKGNLNFNALLAVMPPLVADSVIVHELCHLRHMDHSKAFYDEVRRYFPEYDECDKWLKENGAYYLARL